MRLECRGESQRPGAGDAGAARDHVAAGELVGGDVAEVEGDAGAGGGLLAGFAADVEGAGAELARLALGAGGDIEVVIASNSSATPADGVPARESSVTRLGAVVVDRDGAVWFADAGVLRSILAA